VLRHSLAIMFVPAGIDPAQIRSFIGMSLAVLMKVYWHHAPMFQAEIAQATPKNRGTESEQDELGWLGMSRFYGG
jgi:hypothetical protein